MPKVKNGVIETSTGNLKRSGFCNFLNDGSFDSGSETIRTDISLDSKVFDGEEESQYSRWNGSDWVLIEK